MMLLSNVLQESIDKYGDYEFLYAGERTYSVKEIDRLSTKLQHYFDSLRENISKNIIVFLPNCPEVIIAYQAILKQGAVVVPVMYALSPKEVKYIIEDSSSNTIITSSALLENIKGILNEFKITMNIIVVDPVEVDDFNENIHISQLSDIYHQAHHNDPAINATNTNEDDLAVILYTSGTTGNPKGVMLTHRNLYISAAAVARLMKNEVERETTVVALPLAHSFGFTAMNMYLLSGSSVVIVEKFNPDEIFAAIEKYKIKTFTAVPAMLYGMVMSPNLEKYDLSSLEGVLCSSAPLPTALMKAFSEKVGTEVWQGYGLSEAAPVVSTNWRGIGNKPGSVGPPIDIVEVIVVDEDGKELSKGEVGELVVKGLNVTQGYYKLPEETENTFVNGWLRTGDLAYIDEDNNIFIVDRKKDMIIRGGLNIFPRDVEEVIVAHQEVLEVAVIGVPDDRMGERVVAYVVKRPGSSITELDIISYSQEHLAKYKTPQEVIFIEQLIRNGVGKVLKRSLSNFYQQSVVND